MGGVKLQILAPRDFAQQFDYKHKEGAIAAYLANFGRFQFGTSISAPVYYPLMMNTACENMATEAAMASQ